MDTAVNTTNASSWAPTNTVLRIRISIFLWSYPDPSMCKRGSGIYALLMKLSKNLNSIFCGRIRILENVWIRIQHYQIEANTSQFSAHQFRFYNYMHLKCMKLNCEKRNLNLNLREEKNIRINLKCRIRIHIQECGSAALVPTTMPRVQSISSFLKDPSMPKKSECSLGLPGRFDSSVLYLANINLGID